MLDVLIRGGLVVDGSGAAGRVADVGIAGDRIAAVGRLDGAEAGQVVAAAGRVVCPGFIDVHVHSELALLAGRDRTAPLRMGVTTQVGSPDGFSWAPLRAERLAEMRAHLRPFYADAVLDAPGDMSVDGFLARFRGRLPGNLALQAPHAAIRLAVMGWAARAATDAEIAAMGGLLRVWLEEGACAFATGLEYEPMRHADLRELIGLAGVAREYGALYVAHQRGYGDRVAAGCRETFAIAEAAGLPAHISHLAVDDAAAEALEWAAGRGLDVTFDMYPYPAGCTHLLMTFPESVQAGPPGRVLERLRDPALRAEAGAAAARSVPLHLLRFAAVGASGDTGWEGRSLPEVADELGLPVGEAMCEVLVRTGLQALMIYHWPPERRPYLERTFRHPRHMVATDGIYVGERPHPRGFGTFPKVLGEFAYRGGWLAPEQAIRKMTGLPAARFGIRGRGVLAAGHFADVVVFDPAAIGSRAGFADPRRAPEGIEWVLVNGEVALRHGEIRADSAGRILRR